MATTTVFAVRVFRSLATFKVFNGHLYFLRGTLGSQTGKFSQLRVNFVFKVVLTCTAEGHNTSGDACLV